MKKTFLSYVAIFMAFVFNVSVVAQTAPTLEKLTGDEEIYHFYLSQGVAVDAQGITYVTAATDGASDGGSDRADTQKRGIFVYDAELNCLNPENVGFLPANAAALMTDVSRQAMHRIAVNPVNGQVAFCYNVEGASAIWSMDPANLTGDAVNLIEGLAITKANAFCFDAEGTLYVMDNANTADGGKIVKVVNGELVTVAQNATWGVQDISLASDGRGGLWVAQNRWAVDAYAVLSHVNAAGEVDFLVNGDAADEVKALFPNDYNASYRGQCAYNVDKDILAFGGNKVVTLFQVTYDETTGVPSIAKLVSTEAIGSNIDGIAFYPNGDLAVVSASAERFIKYAVKYPVEIKGVVKRAIQYYDATIVLTHEADGTAHIYNVVDGVITEVSQEGVVAVDPENAGDFLAISDIALTEDGKLVATNKIVCQASDDQVDEGYKRGEFRAYIWNDLAGAPSVLLTSKMSSNWYRSVQGHTIAYKGTSTNGTLFTTGVTATGVKFRYSVYNVIDGVYTEPAVNDSEHFHFTKGSAQTTDALGANYQLVASPLAATNWILDGELVDPFEIVDPLTYNTEVTANPALAIDLGKKYNGTSIVTVGEQHLMVAPYATAEGLLAGVKVLDITAGLAAATEVATADLDAAVEATAAATAVAVAENVLTITLVADATIYTLNVELESKPNYMLLEDNITNLVIDLESMAIIGGPSTMWQVEVFLGLAEDDNMDGQWSLSPESSVAIMGFDARFIDGYVYDIDVNAPAAKAVLHVEDNGLFYEIKLNMTNTPQEAIVVVVEDATVTIDTIPLFGDAVDYALKMTGDWTYAEDGVTYPVLVEVPVYYPEATEPSEMTCTVTIGGMGDTDPWLGFGEGTLTITTVDDVVTAKGLVANPYTGVAFDVTVSGKLPKGPVDGVDNVQVDTKAVKVIKNGMLIIHKDGVDYTIHGAVVK